MSKKRLYIDGQAPRSPAGIRAGQRFSKLIRPFIERQLKSYDRIDLEHALSLQLSLEFTIASLRGKLSKKR